MFSDNAVGAATITIPTHKSPTYLRVECIDLVRTV
jgi:hypothetical protein